MDSSSGLECLVFLHTWPELLCKPLVYLRSSVCSSWASCSETQDLWKLRALTWSSRLISGLCTGVYAIAQAGRTDSRRSTGTHLSLFLSFFPSFFLSFCYAFCLSRSVSLTFFSLLFYTAFQSSPWCLRFVYFYILLTLFHSFRLAFFFCI